VRERDAEGGPVTGSTLSPHLPHIMPGMRDDETRSRRFAKKLREKLTDAERILWSRLRARQIAGFHFRKQHPIGPFVVDFACTQAMLVVEVDGATHGSDAEIEYDKRRTDYLRRRGWYEVRVWNYDVYESLQAVLELIEREATRLTAEAQHCPPPASLREASSPASGGGKT